MSFSDQLAWLFIMPLAISAVSWTITHEEIFREPREYCVRRSRDSKTILKRKFFYIFTCEYCFSHYVTIFFLCITHYKLLLVDWRGYLLSGFALIWIANIYMSLFALLRTDLKKEKLEAQQEEKKLEEESGNK
jgi:hypothetical protein